MVIIETPSLRSLMLEHTESMIQLFTLIRIIENNNELKDKNNTATSSTQQNDSNSKEDSLNADESPNLLNNKVLETVPEGSIEESRPSTHRSERSEELIDNTESSPRKSQKVQNLFDEAKVSEGDLIKEKNELLEVLLKSHVEMYRKSVERFQNNFNLEFKTLNSQIKNFSNYKIEWNEIDTKKELSDFAIRDKVDSNLDQISSFFYCLTQSTNTIPLSLGIIRKRMSGSENDNFDDTLMNGTIEEINEDDFQEIEYATKRISELTNQVTMLTQENQKLTKAINSAIRLSLNLDKFKIDLIQSSGLGNIIDLLSPDVFLKENAKRMLFKFNESEGSIKASSIKYQGEAIRPPYYEYLQRYDLFYFFWENKMISLDKNGMFSTYSSVKPSTPKFIVKNSSDTIIVYPISSRKLTICIHKDTEDMVGVVDRMLEVSLACPVSAIFLVDETTMISIDDSNFFKAFDLKHKETKAVMSTPLYPKSRYANYSETADMPRSSSFFRTQTIRFCLSKGFLLAQNLKTSIFDLFALVENYKPTFLTSLQTQLSAYAIPNIHLDFFGYPIITIFEKKPNGKYQIISYLFFENAFICLCDKKVLNYEFIYKIKNFGSKIYVIGGTNTPNGGRVISIGVNF